MIDHWLIHDGVDCYLINTEGQKTIYWNKPQPTQNSLNYELSFLSEILSIYIRNFNSIEVKKRTIPTFLTGPQNDPFSLWLNA